MEYHPVTQYSDLVMRTTLAGAVGGGIMAPTTSSMAAPVMRTTWQPAPSTHQLPFDRSGSHSARPFSQYVRREDVVHSGGGGGGIEARSEAGARARMGLDVSIASSSPVNSSSFPRNRHGSFAESHNTFPFQQQLTLPLQSQLPQSQVHRNPSSSPQFHHHHAGRGRSFESLDFPTSSGLIGGAEGQAQGGAAGGSAAIGSFSAMKGDTLAEEVSAATGGWEARWKQEEEDRHNQRGSIRQHHPRKLGRGEMQRDH
ncbi:unnamed protein product [Choristocarpus tenellus]